MGWAAGWGGARGGKNYPPGHPISNYDVHTVANDTPVGHIASAWEVPTAQLVPPMGAIVPAMTLEGWQDALQKSRPVNI